MFARKQTEAQVVGNLEFSKDKLPTQIFINNKYVDANGSKKYNLLNQILIA